MADREFWEEFLNLYKLYPCLSNSKCKEYFLSLKCLTTQLLRPKARVAEAPPLLFHCPTKKSRLADLERQLKTLISQTNMDNISTGSAGLSAKDQVKAEIDKIIASECLYCGENMIRNIDKPFINDFEYDTVLKEWE